MSSTPSPAAMLKKLMEELSTQLGALQAGMTSLSRTTVVGAGFEADEELWDGLAFTPDTCEALKTLTQHHLT